MELTPRYQGHGNRWFQEGPTWYLRPRIRLDEVQALKEAADYFLKNGQPSKATHTSLLTIMQKLNFTPYEDILQKEREKNPGNPLIPVLEQVLRTEGRS